MSQLHSFAFSRRPAPSREAGFSFLEATISSVMVLLLAWLVSTLTIDGMRAQKFTERQARVTEIAQDVVDDMRSGLGSAVRVFSNDTVGIAYRDALLLGSNMPTPIPISRLPLVVAAAMLEQEEAILPRTGNELMFARYAWTDEFTVSGGSTYRIDVYRIERWYLTAAGQGPAADRPDGLNLARWVSEPLVDGSQVNRVTDPDDQQEVLRHLFDATPDDTGVSRDATEVVWLVGEDPALTGTFRSIDSMGDLSDAPPAARTALGGWRLLDSPRRSDPDILIYRHHSVATNFAPAVMGTGRFSIVDLVGGFPHGFEVQVVGTAAARQILLHLTLVSTAAGGRRAYHDLQVVADVRDL